MNEAEKACKVFMADSLTKNTMLLDPLKSAVEYAFIIGFWKGKNAGLAEAQKSLESLS